MKILQAGAVVINGGEALSLFTPPDRWSFPKGHVEAGEEPVSTAERELFEELGVRGRPHRCVGRFEFEKGNRTYDLLLFRFSLVSGHPKAKVHNNTTARWLSLSEAETMRSYHSGYLHAMKAALADLSV